MIIESSDNMERFLWKNSTDVSNRPESQDHMKDQYLAQKRNSKKMPNAFY